MDNKIKEIVKNAHKKRQPVKSVMDEILEDLEMKKSEREYFNIDSFNADGIFCGAIVNGSWNKCITDNEYKVLSTLGIYEYPSGEYLENRDF